MAELIVGLAGAECVDEVRALWLDLHQHERGVATSIPFTEDEQSWRRRRALYVRSLEREEGFLALARNGSHVVGYAFVLLEEGSDDTFRLGERYAELSSLSVARESRGRGIGTQLLDFVGARGRCEERALIVVSGPSFGGLNWPDDGVSFAGGTDVWFLGSSSCANAASRSRGWRPRERWSYGPAGWDAA